MLPMENFLLRALGVGFKHRNQTLFEHLFQKLKGLVALYQDRL